MTDVKSAKTYYGEIRFCSEKEGSPAHFKTSFSIEATSEVGGIEIFNAINWNGCVLAPGAETLYSEVESQAAQHVVRSLRSLADILERQFSEHDKRST